MNQARVFLSHLNGNRKVMEKGRPPIMGKNVETATQTGCHNTISLKRQIVLFKKNEHKLFQKAGTQIIFFQSFSN